MSVQSLINYPQLENILNHLISKTEKPWGYFQIYKKETLKGNVYAVRVLGSHEDMLTVQHDSGQLYRLYWYSSSNPSVFVTAKNAKFYQKATQTYQKQKNYEVCYKNSPNSLVSAINRMFAGLIKDQITQFFAQNPPQEEKLPLVTVVAE